MKTINKKENIFGDNIAYVEQYDFSKANLNEQTRLEAVTTVASICYQSPKAIGSESLYNRLLAESKGLPSSSFEVVPILFNYEAIKQLVWEDSDVTIEDTDILKYGEKIEDSKYLLTNLRAIINDKEKFGIDLTDYFNTEEECEIIKKHFKVFKYKVDLPTRSQMQRHRTSWQELSRRYVSGDKVPFEFYVSEKMKNVVSNKTILKGYDIFEVEFETSAIIDMCLNHYYKALKDGIKPQEARRIIPQAAYTEFWGAWQPSYLENFLKMRCDAHAQYEIRMVAEAMKELL